MPYYILQSLHNMAQFVKQSKNPMNFISNHILIGLLIHRIMGLPHDPLPKVFVPPTVPISIANLENPISTLVVTANTENSTLVPSTTPVVKTSTVIPRKPTVNTKHKIRRTSHTTQKRLDSVQQEHKPNPIATEVTEPHEP